QLLQRLNAVKDAFNLWCGRRYMQFQQTADEFLRFCVFERQHSIHTVSAYTLDLADFYKWLKRQIDGSEITSDVLRGYLEHLVERRLAPATIRRRLACLRAFFRRAAEHNQAPDPFATWRPVLPRRKQLPRSLTRSEASFLVHCSAATLKVVFHTIVRLMIATGMRVSEVCKLRIEDLSPDCCTLRIQGKGARDRVAYITDTSLQADLSLLRKQRQESCSTNRFLFLNRSGATMRPQSIRSELRRLTGRAG